MAYLKVSGIYKILCRESGKVYVGSAVSIHGRWASHRSQLRRNAHSNRHLQNAWEKYGEGSFFFSILEECGIESLVEREQHWIDAMRAADPDVGMNNSPTASTSIGFRHSENTKQLLSEIASQRDHSHLRRNAENQRGRPGHSKGKPGKKWTEAQRATASAQRTGRAAWNVGIPMSDEVKERLSNHWKRRAEADPLKATACQLRATGMVYKDIAALIGVSLAQAYRYSNHIPVESRRGKRPASA